MPTVGDVWRCYVKPTLNGMLVIRKRNVIRQSEKVRMINRQLEELAAKGEHPAKRAKRECVRHKGWYWTDKKGHRHCKIKYFIRLLRQYMKEKIKPVSGGVPAPAE